MAWIDADSLDLKRFAARYSVCRRSMVGKGKFAPCVSAGRGCLKERPNCFPNHFPIVEPTLPASKNRWASVVIFAMLDR